MNRDIFGENSINLETTLNESKLFAQKGYKLSNDALMFLEDAIKSVSESLEKNIKKLEKSNSEKSNSEKAML